MLRFLAVILLLMMPIVMPFAAAAAPVSYRVGGIVVDAVSGQPLSLAEVTLSPVTALDDLQTFLTAADGRFLFANLAPGKYRLMAGRRGYAVQGFNRHEAYMTAIVAGPGQDSEHLRFRLSPSAVLTGSVTDQWNDPVRDAEVILFEQSWSAGSHSLHPINRTTTNDLGHYRFAHLTPGVYVIGVIARPWWSDLVSQSIENSGHRWLQGTLGGDFAAQALAPSPSVTANPALDLVYPVSYFPNTASLSDAAKLSLRPGATETADVTLRAVPSIHLRVRVPTADPVPAIKETDAADDWQAGVVQTAPEASIVVFDNAGGDSPHPIQTLRTEISPGLFELSGIPPGDITVTVGGSQGQTESSRKQSLQLTANADLDLTPRGPLVDVSGVVLAQQQQAVADPQEESVDQDSQLERTSSFFIELHSRKTGESFKTSVSNKGEFSFAASALTPGTYEVDLSGNPTFQVSSLEATGATVSHRTIEIPGDQPVRLTVHTSQAKCSLTGFALKDGKPFAGAMILLVPQDADQSPALFHRDQSDSDGSFLMAPLFPGRYTLLALENGWDLEWSNPAVLFQYLPNGLSVEIQPNAAANFNAKVQ
jgi:hypothetical protein